MQERIELDNAMSASVEQEQESIARNQTEDIINAIRERKMSVDSSATAASRTQNTFDLSIIKLSYEKGVDEILLACRAAGFPYILTRDGKLNVAW